MKHSHEDLSKWAKIGVAVRQLKAPPWDVRFWMRVDIRGPDECWPSKRKTYPSGYARAYWFGKECLAHRIAYILKKGPVPEGLCVCHKCDNRKCCNPNHLFVGTHKDNTQDCIRKGRFRCEKGSQRGNALLTEQKVKEIRQLRQQGMRPTEVARKFGVHPNTIEYCTIGPGWKHVV